MSTLIIRVSQVLIGALYIALVISWWTDRGWR